MLAQPRIALLKLLAVTAALTSPGAWAQSTIQSFLVIDGVPGDSADSQYPNSIETSFYSTAVSANPQQPSSFSAFAVGARISQASPLLMLAAASGHAVPTAVLSVVKTGSQRQLFLRYTLTNVTVTSHRPFANSAGEVPSEEFTLGYRTITVEYWAQKPDGTLAAPVSACWDTQTNVACPLPTTASHPVRAAAR